MWWFVGQEDQKAGGTIGLGRYKRHSSKDKYTNVSQTYELVVTVTK